MDIAPNWKTSRYSTYSPNPSILVGELLNTVHPIFFRGIMRSPHVTLLVVLAFLVASLNVIPFSGVLAEDARLEIDLNDTDASFSGVANLEYAGFDSAFVGDVNGDQYDDMLVGAPGNEEMGQQAGKAYLIFGSDSGWGMDTPLSNANASFLAENVGEFAGGSVAGACDLNSDGYDDMVISASGNSEVAQFAGKIYIILGKASGWTKDADIESEAVATFLGEAYLDQAGSYLACAEDLNKDGFDDVLVGAPENDEGGQTYIIFGRDSGWAKDVSLANVNASFTGEVGVDFSGADVAGLGDVNGDGYGDILIGASRNTEGGGQHGNVQNQAGQVYIVFGKGSGWAMDASLADADASFWGRIGDHLGNILDGVGDINNDGYNDMLIGLPWSSDGFDQQGKVYLILGKESGWTMDKKLDANCDASFLGASTREYAGSQVSGAGDFNDDGIDDLYIAAGGSANGNLDTSAYILFGKEEGWSRDMTLANADLVFTGSTSNRAIDGGADFNGDGIDDVLYSDAYNDETGGNAGQVHLTYGFQLSEPTGIDSITIYSDDQYTNETTWADVLCTIYYEVKATGGDPTRIDSLVVNITSDPGDPIGFLVRLYETGLDTGSYRGYLVIQDTTNSGNRWIYAVPGHHIHVTAVMDPTKSDTVLVGHVTIKPWIDHDTVVEDMDYMIQFFAENGTNVEMTIETNADWPQINSTSNLIQGVPDNTDVGTWWVKVTADDGYGNTDEENYDIEVINAAPIILTDPLFDATEDVPYGVDFNSSDDGQGTITWHLDTNSSWLDLDTDTGVLSGLPLNEDAGYDWANVSVTDGNGGKEWSNFTVTVHDVNEPPTITTEDQTVAYEDQLYAVKYKAEDIDLYDNNFHWYLYTDAEWLSMDELTGVLYGTPDNNDIGSYQVNVTVKDRVSTEDRSSFTLEVMNTPPSILNKDVLKATEDQPYNVHYSCDDDGQGDITWSMTTDASWLKLDPASNNLTGAPGNEDVGTYQVEVTVDDGNGGKNSTSFTLEVVNVNDPPTITSLPMANATVDTTYIYDVEVSDIDKDDIHNVSLQKAPTGMTIDHTTGMISWTPTVGQEGEHVVLVDVFDGTISVLQNFTITVWPNLVVTITNLTEGQKITKGYSVSGTAKGPSDLKVEVDIDGKGWVEADGANSWKYELDTNKLKDGKHTIKVRASWKGNISQEVTVTFRVQQEQASFGDAFLLIAIFIIIAVVVAIVIFMMKRRGKDS